MAAFLQHDQATDIIVGQLGKYDPDFVGPEDIESLRPEMPGFLFIWMTAPIDWRARPSDTAQLKWNNGNHAWVEVATVEGLLEHAMAKTYLDVDRVHEDAVGSRTTEYQDALAAAEAFAAAGFQGAVDSDVHDFALFNPTGQVQTDQWAAEQIMARAGAFRAAQKAMRSMRFQRQAEMRAAATVEELRAVETQWNHFITTLRAHLGLPSA